MKTMASYVLALALPLGSLFGSTVAEAKMVNESWNLEGPRSGADVKRIEREIKQLPGVETFQLTQASLDIRYDDEKLSEAQLREAIAKAGDFRLMRPVE
jgi:copper chaperone CopZ